MTNDDTAAIGRIIDTMYAALCWSPERPPDWDAFRAVFREDAVLYPSARPTTPTTVEPFIARMSDLRAGGEIVRFDEEKFKDSLLVFGNIAVALSSYAATIDGKRQSRGINALLLTKDAGEWRCAAMAWDGEDEEKPIPAAYL